MGKTTSTETDELTEGGATATSAIPSGSTEAGIPYSQLRNSLNQRKTQSLFLETNYHRESEDPAPFTLQPFDYKGKVSLKRLYMESSDPTEYSFAIRAFGCWEHWQRLAGSSFFKPHVESWRDELEVKLRSEAIRMVREDAPDNATSAKWLAEKGWEKSGGKRGRPTKAEIDRERKRLATISADLEDDASRVFGSDSTH